MCFQDNPLDKREHCIIHICFILRYCNFGSKLLKKFEGKLGKCDSEGIAKDNFGKNAWGKRMVNSLGENLVKLGKKFWGKRFGEKPCLGEKPDTLGKTSGKKSLGKNVSGGKTADALGEKVGENTWGKNIV
ncbi:MAG: hypothetical protein NWF09_02675 [Candidatus Bathyarchaeota archaeon]|nr:hypothetical protein [Candidatus Bathyarchaeota archaeon]